MNRILRAIEKAKAVIAQKNLSPEKVAEMSKKMEMNLEEYFLFQELKSALSGTGCLTTEEAQTIYNFLGTTPEHFNKQPLPVKWVLTEVFAAFLKR